MKKPPPPNFKKILEDKRKAHAADLRRTSDNFKLLKTRVAEIHNQIPDTINYHEQPRGIDEMSFWFRGHVSINFVIKAGPFGFVVNSKYGNLDVSIGLLAKWIAENEGEER